jgi:hypothetical protein
MTFIALMWSMPGSRPSSLSRMTPAALARASRARIAGETYDVVTRCLPWARQRSAMATWWMYGSIDTHTSLSATRRSRASASAMSNATALPRGLAPRSASARSTLRAATVTVCDELSRM